MPVFKEFGHQGSTVVMQEAAYEGVLYLIDSEGTVHEKKTGFPVVKDEELIKAVKKASA